MRNGTNEAKLPEMSVHLFNSRFDDIDVLLQAMKGLNWSFETRQLDKGNFQISIRNIMLPDFQLGYCAFGRHLDQMGAAPAKLWTFVFLKSGRAIRRGIESSPDEILVFKPGAEFKTICWPGFENIALSLSESLLEKACGEQKLHGFMKLIRSNDTLSADPKVLQQFSGFLAKVLDANLNNHLSENSPVSMRYLFYSEIPQRLCNLVVSPAQKKKIHTTPMREHALKRAMAYLKESADASLKVTDLCTAAGVSKRSLEYAFHEYYGISPKEYIKAYLLNQAHLALTRANPNATKVIDIAHQWGFWHMGHFTADYRRLFGELPSETLNRG